MTTNTIDGVWIDDDKIELFDPATGKDLARWDNPSRETVDVALAIRAFYVEGREAFKRHNDEKRFVFRVEGCGEARMFRADSASEAAQAVAEAYYKGTVVTYCVRISSGVGDYAGFGCTVDNEQRPRIKVRLEEKGGAR